METLAGAALNIDDYLEIRPMNDWMQGGERSGVPAAQCTVKALFQMEQKHIGRNGTEQTKRLGGAS